MSDVRFAECFLLLTPPKIFPDYDEVMTPCACFHPDLFSERYYYMNMLKKRTFFIETYGCEMNKSDSLDIALAFEKRGYTGVCSEKEADVVVLNTCAVRENAEQRVYGRLGYYRSLKRSSGRDFFIVFAGCMAQEKGREIIQDFPEIDICAGTYHCIDIPEYVHECERMNTRCIATDKTQYRFSGFTTKRAEGHRAWVNIIKGCSNNCSYCIVPALRGPEKSKKHEEVLREVGELAEQGVVEITLLGQNVNAYGKDSGDVGFMELLEKIHRIEGIRWIRFLTSHPKDFTVEMIRRISALPKVCKHFHLPLQSGSDRILGLMNRRYTLAHYARLVDAVHEFEPDASVTTDIIVGFPTETEEDFRRTLDACTRFQYDDAFMYKYSERPFTKAATYHGRVDKSVAGRRLEKLIELQRDVSMTKNQKMIGKTSNVLVERTSKKNPAEMLCKSESGKMIVVRTREPVGSFIHAKITGISGSTLCGVHKNRVRSGRSS